MRIGSSESGCGKAVSVAYISAEPDAGRGKNRALHRETGADVRSAAIARCRRADQERQARLKVVILLFRSRRGIEYAKDRAIRHRTQGPLPAVIIGRPTQRPYSDRVQKGVQGDVDVNAGARLQANFFLQGWKERGSRNFDRI